MKNIRKFIEENTLEKNSTITPSGNGSIYFKLITGQIVIYENDGSILLKSHVENVDEKDLFVLSNLGLLNFFNGSCLITLDEYFANKYLKGYGLYLLKLSLEQDLIKRENKSNKYKL